MVGGHAHVGDDDVGSMAGDLADELRGVGCFGHDVKSGVAQQADKARPENASSSAITTRMRTPRHGRAVASSGRNRQPAVQRVNAICEAEKPGSVLGVGSAAAVVSDLDRDTVAMDSDLTLTDRGWRAWRHWSVPRR